MNRRRFLATTLSTALAAATPRGLAAPIPTPGRRIPIGFLGASYSHATDKLRLVLESSDWEFVGAWDDTPAGRRTCERVGARQVDRKTVLGESTVIAVESDIRHHAAHALLALQAGRHVHAEKPIATRTSEARRMIRLARQRNLLLQSGYMWRYNPGFQAIFQAVREGWLGRILMVRATMNNHLAADQRSAWAEFHGGSMFEQGSHLVDAVVRLLGRPRDVHGVLRHHGPFDDTLRDTNVAVLEYDRTTAILTNTALQVAGTPQRSFEVLGTRGSALLSPVEPPTLQLDLAEPAGPHPRGSHRIPLPAYRRYVGDFTDLAAAVRGEHPLAVSLEEESLVAETVLRVSGMN